MKRKNRSRIMAGLLAAALVIGLLPGQFTQAEEAETKYWYSSKTSFDKIKLDGTDVDLTTGDAFAGDISSHRLTGILFDYNGNHAHILEEWVKDDDAYNIKRLHMMDEISVNPYRGDHVTNWGSTGSDMYYFSKSRSADENGFINLACMDGSTPSLREELGGFVKESNYTVEVYHLNSLDDATPIRSVEYVGAKNLSRIPGKAKEVVSAIQGKTSWTIGQKETEYIRISPAKTVTMDYNDGQATETAQYYCTDYYNNTWKLDWNLGKKPTRTGYQFLGWYTEKEGGEAFSDSGLLNGNTLYAHWKPNEYQLQFDPNGGEGTMEKLPMAYGQEQMLPANSFSNTGYRFVGWNTEQDASGTWFMDGQNVINLTSTNGAEVTFYAQWVPVQYQVRFDPNGGEGTMENQSMTCWEEQALSASSFSRIGYLFNGWNTVASGSGVSYADGQTVSNLCLEDGGEAVLYAQWNPVCYQVRFDPNGGEGTMENQSMTYDQEQALSSNAFSYMGRTFEGWNSKADGSGVSYTDGQTVSNLCSQDGMEVILYARWKTEEKKDTGNNDSGTGSGQNTGSSSGGTKQDTGNGSGGTKQNTGSSSGGTKQDTGNSSGGTDQNAGETASFVTGNITYAITGTDSVTVVKAGKGLKKAVLNTVSDGKKSYKVTAVGKGSFKNCNKLKSVTLGKNVTKVGANAFSGCSSLLKVKITSGKLSIGKHAFKKVKAKFQYPAGKQKSLQKKVNMAKK